MQTRKSLETVLSRALAARASGAPCAEGVCWSYLMDDWEPDPPFPEPGDGEAPAGPVVWAGTPIR